MKKFLSLVLALVMTMSLVTISAGAKDFSDADAINYDEAVEVLTAIGVVDGYTDDSFKPGNALNRGQAAKIICNLILGPTTAADLSADTQLFPDVPVDHVFAGYISFCVEEGIISGYADGSFRPAAPLTSYAFMKMLLGALGYDAETEGYVGANWSINVAKRALNIGLAKGLKGDFNGIDTVTREEACLYALNTLKATMVEYDAKTTVIVGDASVALSGNIKEIANTSKTEGNIVADRKMQFGEKYFTKLTLDTDTGIYGRPTNEWKNAKKEIGSYASIDATYVYTESMKEKEVYKDLGKELINEYDWTFYVNGEVVDTKTEETVDGEKYTYYPSGLENSKTSKTEWAYTGEGTVTEIYVDDDAEEVTVIEYNYYLGQVTKVKSDEDGEYITVKEISEGSSLNNKTFYVEGYEEDDYVVYTQDVNEDGKDVIGEVFAPEAVTVEVTRVQKDDDTGATYLRADGEKYTYTEDSVDKDGVATNPAQQDHMAYDLDGDADVVAHPTLNTDYILYLDPNGYVLGFEKAEEEKSEYLYVKDTDEEMDEWTAKVLLADGTTQIVEIDEDEVEFLADNMELKWNDADKELKSTIDGKVFKYSVNDKGEYELEEVVSDTLTNIEIKNGKAYIDDGDNNKVFVDRKTIFVDDENETAYVGYKEVPNMQIEGKAKFIYVVDEKVVEIGFVLDAEIYDTDATYFMLTSQDRESLKYDSKLYWEYEDAYVNGEKTSVIVAYNYDGKAGDDAVLSVATLYQVKKTIDEDYITKIEIVEIDEAGSNPAVGEEAFWLDVADDRGEVKFDTDEETVYVYVEYDEEDDEWTISEGNLKDMKDDDVFAVWVVESDEEYAELVYIFAYVASEDEAVNLPSLNNPTV